MIASSISQDQSEDKDATDAAFSSVKYIDEIQSPDGVNKAITILRNNFKKSKFQKGERSRNSFINLRRLEEEFIDDFIIRSDQVHLDLREVGIQLNSFTSGLHLLKSANSGNKDFLAKVSNSLKEIFDF